MSHSNKSKKKSTKLLKMAHNISDSDSSTSDGDEDLFPTSKITKLDPKKRNSELNQAVPSTRSRKGTSNEELKKNCNIESKRNTRSRQVKSSSVCSTEAKSSSDAGPKKKKSSVESAKISSEVKSRKRLSDGQGKKDSSNESKRAKLNDENSLFDAESEENSSVEDKGAKPDMEMKKDNGMENKRTALSIKSKLAMAGTESKRSESKKSPIASDSKIVKTTACGKKYTESKTDPVVKSNVSINEPRESKKIAPSTESKKSTPSTSKSEPISHCKKVLSGESKKVLSGTLSKITPSELKNYLSKSELVAADMESKTYVIMVKSKKKSTNKLLKKSLTNSYLKKLASNTKLKQSLSSSDMKSNAESKKTGMNAESKKPTPPSSDKSAVTEAKTSTSKPSGPLESKPSGSDFEFAKPASITESKKCVPDFEFVKPSGVPPRRASQNSNRKKTGPGLNGVRGVLTRIRPPCKYGDKCYRKNPEHFKDYSHPPSVEGHEEIAFATPLPVKQGKMVTGLLSKKGLKVCVKQSSGKSNKAASSPAKESKTVSNVSSGRQNKMFANLFSGMEIRTSSHSSSKSPESVQFKKGLHRFEKYKSLFNFYMTNVRGIPRQYNNTIAYGIKDLLDSCMGRLVESVQFNYAFDIAWMMEQYPQEFRQCPLTVVHGEPNSTVADLEASGAKFNITFVQAKLEIPYGTHHTKMMFLLYESGLRIVIHTSNMIRSDWGQKTQGMWVSPVFSRLKGGPSLTDGESITHFKADLLEYVSAYRHKVVDAWCERLKEYDLSTARVFLIGSVPGRHLGSKKTSFGHLKLRKILNMDGPSRTSVDSSWPVIGQFSSIGSLGPAADKWLCKEWLSSLGTYSGTTPLLSAAALKLIYPSVENVRKSLEGYPAGTALPYGIEVASKQLYLKNFLYEWKSDWIGRSEASPHIKTYLRVSPENERIAWCLITSANLSKAAWGAFEKNETQLMIRSYELGVLFLPKYFGCTEFFRVPTCQPAKDMIPFPLPFDIPVSKYSSKDEPWIWDIPHTYAPDRNGKGWYPPGPIDDG